MNELALIASNLCLLIVVALIVHDNRAARREWARERGDLVQRIQAPAQAVLAHAQPEEPNASPPAVLPDSDEDFWESREALAERLAAEETNGSRHG